MASNKTAHLLSLGFHPRHLLLPLLSLLLLLPLNGARAQSPKVQVLTVDDGLSQGMIFDMLQSQDGFMWFATGAGLNRYDGARFRVYEHDPFDPFSIASDKVLRLFEDSRGWLWILFEEGVDVFVPEYQQFFHLMETPPIGLYAMGVSFAELSDGTVLLLNQGKLWKIVVPAGILERAKKDNNAFPGLRSEPFQLKAPTGIAPDSLSFSQLFMTQNKALLLCGNDGLFRLDPSTAKLQREGLAGKMVRIMGEDMLGQVWMLTMVPITVGAGRVIPDKIEHAFVWDHHTGIHTEAYQTPKPFRAHAGAPWSNKIPNNGYLLDCFDKDGYVWTTSGTTVAQWDVNDWVNAGSPKFEWSLDLISTGGCHTLYMDRSRNVWGGTAGFGLIKINPAKSKFCKYNIGSARSFLEDPQGNLISLNQKGNPIYGSKRFDHPRPNPWFAHEPKVGQTRSAIFDKIGNCWINSSRQLKRIDAITKKEMAFPWKSKGLIYTKHQKLLSAGEKGLEEFDPETKQSRYYPYGMLLTKKPADDTFTHYLYEDPGGVVWIFEKKGLLKASPVGNGYHYAHFANKPADPNSLSNDHVLCVAADPLEPQRYLWVGTKGGGLNRLDLQSGKFQHYKKAQGLPNNVVNGILPGQQGFIWLSTNMGLCRFHTRTGSIQNFTMEDGLSGNEFNRAGYAKLRDGTLIFAGVNGVTVFHPDSIHFNEHLPQMQIVGITANNEPVKLAPSIALAYDQNLITIDFAALEFSDPSKNQYRYRLTRHRFFGHDAAADWVDLGYENKVQFAQLPPASYTFEVLGCNNDGIWSEQPAVLHFNIRPPVWASWWAYLLYTLLLGSLIGLFYRYQVRLQLQQQEASTLKDLDRIKSRFFANISHEFRTPLTLILGPISKAIKHTEPLEPAALGLIQRHAQQLLRLINQILDLSKMEEGEMKVFFVRGDVIALLKRMVEPFESFARGQQKQLVFHSELPSLEMDYDKQKLQGIISNLLSNALKFTQKGDTIAVGVVPSGKELLITVKDSGAGIAEEDIPYLFDRFYQIEAKRSATPTKGSGIGLSFTKQLTELLGGRITVESQLGLGSSFTVRLPIQVKAAQADEDYRLQDTVLPAPARSAPQKKADIKPVHKDTNGEIQVLIVEDTPDLAQYIATCLPDHYQISFAENGQEGIDKALEEIPDIIISDVMMPEKDGFELCQTLKNDVRSSHIPIILLTALADAEARVTGLRRGADAYLAKPFDEEELRVRVVKLIELRQKLREHYANLEVSPTHTSQFDIEDEFLQKLIQVIEENIDNTDFSATELYTAAYMSQSQLYRKLMALTGKSPAVFIRSVRLRKAIVLLQNTEMSISEISWATGFSTPSYFTRAFQEEFGKVPKALRN